MSELRSKSVFGALVGYKLPALLLCAVVAAVVFMPAADARAADFDSRFDNQTYTSNTLSLTQSQLPPGLEHLARDITGPDNSIWTGRSGDDINSAYVPAVPPALLLGLTGFLCVTMVKDRKFWILLALGALSLSFAGLHTATKLVCSVRLTNHGHNRKLQTSSAGRSYLGQSRRKRADIEGTGYIALLHYLEGLPGGALSLTDIPQLTTSAPGRRDYGQPQPRFVISDIFAESLMQCERRNTSLYDIKTHAAPAFWPGFSFDLLAHGPPA